MLSFSVTFFITIVNVTFLYVILRRILFKPVAKFVQDRTESIQKDLDAAKRTSARAEALLAEYEAKMEDAAAEGQRIVQMAQEKAEKEYREILAKAKADAALILQSSLRDLELERRQAEQALRGNTADIAIQAASRILGENVDSGKNRTLVEKFLASVGAA